MGGTPVTRAPTVDCETLTSPLYARSLQYYQFPPAPFGYRYVLIGGRVVLIDPGYRVLD